MTYKLLTAGFVLLTLAAASATIDSQRRRPPHARRSPRRKPIAG